MTLNGKEVLLNTPVSLQAFLQMRDYKPQHIAVELNGEIVPREAYETCVIQNSDVVEIVRFVGGG